MINETIEHISFDEAFEVTSDPYFFIPLIILMVLPFIVYLIWGAISSARTPHGDKIPNSNAIFTTNFWIIFVIFLALLAIATILIINPVWLKFF